MIIRPVITLAIVVAWLSLCISSAYSHSWYDSSCCSQTDCKAVEDTDVEETKDGWKYIPLSIEFKKSQIKVSQDKHFHVCYVESTSEYEGNSKPNYLPRCIYIKIGY